MFRLRGLNIRSTIPFPLSLMVKLFGKAVAINDYSVLKEYRNTYYVLGVKCKPKQ